MQDMVNRRISMQLMVVCASEQRSKQFIFLTPQDMRYRVAKNICTDTRNVTWYMYTFLLCNQMIFGE